MFGDIFDTAEQLLSGQKEGQVLSSWERLARNCADKLPMPQIPKKAGYPIGLKNQGATCYLNSLFQVLYHTPEFRNIMLQLPLCLNNAQTSSGFVNESRHKFLLGFQRLFSEMSACDQKAVGTQYLNKAFNWENAQHLEQQDIQQAMRVIFDTIERALAGTNYHQSARSLFKGSTIRYKTCKACGQTAQHSEEFYDLNLQVKNISSVTESLLALTTAEGMEGDNAIYCEICQSKQDMWLGTRLQQLPDTLVLTLSRFDFDYEILDRVKINAYFQYQLQLDLSGFVMQGQPEHCKYQLYGVVIHRGSAHGGHYICFARDLMKETDWKTGLVEAAAQEARIKEGAQTKQKQKQKQKQEKQHKMAEPENKDLLENWFEINDNVATAINANRLASQFQGSSSAYILFYRRKSLKLGENKVNPPPYFADPIAEANKIMAKQRQAYLFQKQHIILNINGDDHKLKVSTTLNDFKQTYIPLGSALVLEHEHNGLPYYPMQIINHPDAVSQQTQTLQTLQVPHQSKWRQYQLATPEYQQIKGVIGKGRLPLEVVLLIDGEQPKRIVAYSDENLLMLRIQIEKTANISYQNQIITLVTPYKQTTLTETLTNDDVLLPKLGIVHGAQLQLKSLGEQQEGTGKQSEKKDNGMLICFVIERDDVIGLKRFYFQRTKTLQELFDYFINMESLNDNIKRRFRNLNNSNRLYYTEHYQKTLEQLQFSEEMVRLRLQRGEIPIKGDICVKIKIQSTLIPKKESSQQSPKIQNAEELPKIQKIFDPNTPIQQVKQWACLSQNLDPSLHKLYLTDWMTEPVRSLTRQKLTLFEANFGREETLCLRDIHSPIGAELVHLEVFSTITGSPDTTTKEGIHVKIQQFKTVLNLKQLLISTLQLKDVTPDRLRLRQIKRDYMFGSIWRENNKSVKTVTTNSSKVVYQILQKPQALTQQQIVLIVKKRNREKRVYDGVIEVIFEAGRNPNIQQLTEVIKQKVSIQQEVTLVKYFHYNFQWIEMSRKNIEALAKNKKNNQKGKKGQNHKAKPAQNKKVQEGANKNEEKPKKQEGKAKNKKGEQPKQKKEIQNIKKQEVKVIENVQNIGQKQIQKQPQVKQNEAKPKKQKKGGKADQQKQLLQECQNLRKAPILLKDGDILGWALTSQLEGDDLQTDEDLAWRVTLKNQPTKYKGKQQGGFKLNVDF